ncbi:dolichol-phosphate mannose synthase subunit 2-like isoform X1 [Miscanthus floridulus]|uniref:dolichol-phosphate mannose synthase subunit 2-like isoform X1 n=1 Tax=Miscanthus floridulus TaxID=154761 RepID=UPI00345ABB19
MSAGGAFGGNRGARPIPPEKCVFPLDHLHECDLEKKDYLSCLKSTGFQSEKCRLFSKKYLECRMERQMELGDKVVGFLLTLTSLSIFTYYTFWVIILPFVDSDHFVHKYFLPQEYAILIPVLAGVVLLSFLSVFVGLVMLKSKKKKKKTT